MQVFAPSIFPFTVTLPQMIARFQGYALTKTALCHPIKHCCFLFFLILTTQQKMVEGWQRFTTSDFDVDLVQGNHLFVYNADVRDDWFESITDFLTGEGF